MKDLHTAKKGIAQGPTFRNLQRYRLTLSIEQAQLVAVEIVARGNVPMQLQQAAAISLCFDGALLGAYQLERLFRTQDFGLRSGLVGIQAG